MIKGCQRKIYHIKNPESSIFEEAYFVLKKRIAVQYMPGSYHVSETEMSEEAGRLIREVCRNCRGASEKGIVIGKAGAFALGAASSSALIGCAALLLALL